MQTVLIKLRRHALNVHAIADAKWESEKLYLHFIGGGFAALTANDAALVWKVLESMSLDLETGEVGQAVVDSVSR